MFDLCLFDLDQTLVDTADMETLRESGKNDDSEAYKAKVRSAFRSRTDRLIYSRAELETLRNQHPQMKFGVFTRAPRSYTEVVLSEAYGNLGWFIIVSRESVPNTKPHGDGVLLASTTAGVPVARVVLVGDGDADVRAAYNAGCHVVLDQSKWDRSYVPDNWRALDRVPDACIDEKSDLTGVLSRPNAHLPYLERMLAADTSAAPTRFVRLNKFIPRDAGGDKKAFPINAGGRYFSKYASLTAKRADHLLTQQIEAHKNALTFPPAWIALVHKFLASDSRVRLWTNVIIATIPHRPDRHPRLEAFLSQLQGSPPPKPTNPFIPVKTPTYVHDLLRYKAGVRSNSGDKLTAVERFENVRDHLFVNRPELITPASRFLIIDDVCTTGSTLIYAKKRLLEAGAGEVELLSIAMNISNVLYNE